MIPTRVERVRITAVGVGVVLLAIVVGLAAVNTGNNALYLVEAVLLALLASSGVLSRRNVQKIEVEARAPAEIFANRPAALEYRLENRDRLFSKRLLTVSLDPRTAARLIGNLPRGGSASGRLDLLFGRRGVHAVPFLRVGSVFPFGLFRKVVRGWIDLEILVYPEIFPVGPQPAEERGRSGELPSHRPGWGHELLTLRGFRAGDDPRGIHWKQSARTGGLIFMERDREEERRLSIALDNAVGRLESEAEAQRFERLVSEAASGAVHYLDRGYAVELVTRDDWIPYGTGLAQRRRILEALARLETCPPAAAPLAASRGGLRLGLPRTVAGAAR